MKVHTLPCNLLSLLEDAPGDRAIVLLIRHSVRGPLPPGSAGDATPLTAEGIELARELGARLGHRLVGLYTSPVLRCVQTATELGAGAGVSLPVVSDTLLGNPGAFVLDAEVAGAQWLQLGHEAMVTRLCGPGEPPPGMATPRLAAKYLLMSMLGRANVSGFHVFVTHDSLVTVTAAHILRAPLTVADSPVFLEAAWAWRDDQTVHFGYREQAAAVQLSDIASYSPQAVIELAERVAGSLCRAPEPAGRFYLIGRFFETLVTGLFAQVVELSAPNVLDHDAVRAALLSSGAGQLPPADGNEWFLWAGRMVALRISLAELRPLVVPLDAEIPGSTFGVEFRPGAAPRAVAVGGVLGDGRG